MFGKEGVIERVEMKSEEKLLHLVRIGCGDASGGIVEERVVDNSGEGIVGGRGRTLFMRDPCNRWIMIGATSKATRAPHWRRRIVLTASVHANEKTILRDTARCCSLRMDVCPKARRVR